MNGYRNHVTSDYVIPGAIKLGAVMLDPIGSTKALAVNAAGNIVKKHIPDKITNADTEWVDEHPGVKRAIQVVSNVAGKVEPYVSVADMALDHIPDEVKRNIPYLRTINGVIQSLDPSVDVIQGIDGIATGDTHEVVDMLEDIGADRLGGQKALWLFLRQQDQQ